MSPPLLQQRWPWIVAALVVVAVFVWTNVDIRYGPPRRTGSVADIEALASRDDVNVLFILVDTLRADRLGAYGYERDTSPLFDSLANSGVRFDRNLAQSSWTKTSMASLWTGLYPPRTGIGNFSHVLPETATLASEIFQAAGFQTAGLWRNSWVENAFGFSQGFDVYHKPAGTPLPPGVVRENPTVKQIGTDGDTVPVALEFLRQNRDRRWFLYLHLMDLHEYLYDEDSAKFGTAYSDVYDNSILRTNHALTPVFNYLAETGLLEKTLVVLASDHGEAFGERGLEGHGRFLYRETTHVPLILSFPFRLEPGVVVGTRTQNIDIWPTVLELLGLPPLPGADGRSRVPEILAAARGAPLPESDEATFASLDQNWGKRDSDPAWTVTVVGKGYRYVMGPRLIGVPGGNIFEDLFLLAEDEPELSDVSDENPAAVEGFRKQAGEYLEMEPAWGDATPELELDEIRLQQLRALGYKVE